MSIDHKRQPGKSPLYRPLPGPVLGAVVFHPFLATDSERRRAIWETCQLLGGPRTVQAIGCRVASSTTPSARGGVQAAQFYLQPNHLARIAWFAQSAIGPIWPNAGIDQYVPMA